MKFSMMLAATAAAALMAGAAQAATITVTPTLGLNGYGSPNYNAWAANSIYAQSHGLSSYGDSSQPTYYEAQSNVTSEESIVTGFSSFKGVADAPAPFDHELGNRMLFGVLIDGGGSQFSIGQLSFTMDSDDPYDALDYAYGAGAYNYSNDYQGVLAGSDGILWTADDIRITSGPNTQLVDGLVGRGSGNSLAAYCPGCDHAAKQAAIDDAAGYFNQFPVTHFTGTYFLDTTQGLFTGSGTFNISGAVPEPGTWALMIAGFGGMGAMLRRRRSLALAA